MYRGSALEAFSWSDLLEGHQPAEGRSRAEVAYRVVAAAEHGARYSLSWDEEPRFTDSARLRRIRA